MSYPEFRYLDFSNCLLILTFILSIPCHGLVIKVNLHDPKSIEGTLSSNPPREMTFSYYTLEVNGKTTMCLKDHGFPDTQKGEAVEFDLGDKKIRLPDEMGKRLVTILSSGIEDEIVTLPYYLAYKTSNSANSPPCSVVMFYLAFGVTDFIRPALESSRVLLSEEGSLSDLLPSLQPFNVIFMESKADPADKNAVIYLGNNLFLYWENGSSSFFIKSAEFLDGTKNDAGRRYYWYEKLVGDDSPVTEEQFMAAFAKLHALANSRTSGSTAEAGSCSYIK